MKWSAFLLVILTLFVTCNCKYVDGIAYLSRTFVYLNKFSYSTGKGNFQGTVTSLIGPNANEIPNDLSILLYLDEDWEQVYQNTMLTCEEKVALARTSFPISFADNSFVEIRSKIAQVIRPHWWFVVLSSCSSDNLNTKGMRVRYELEFKNPDNSHLGFDDEGLPTLHLLLIIVLLYFNVRWFMRWNEITKQRNEFIPLHLVFLFATFIYFVSHVAEYIHLDIYIYNGEGSGFFNFVSYFCLIVSKIVIACAFLLMSFGWTFTTRDFEPFGPFFVPIFILISVSHLALVILAYMFDRPDKFHDFETFPGMMLNLLRTCMFVGFVTGVRRTLDGKAIVSPWESSRLSHQSRVFFIKFAYFGGIWYLSAPFLHLLSIVVAPYYRHKVVTIVTALVQTACLALVGNMLFQKSSTYSKVSTVNKSLLE